MELCLSPGDDRCANALKICGIPKMGEIEDGIPESLDGAGERNLNVVDATKAPKLTIEERNRLKTCGRPCSKEEWRGMPNKNMWKTLLNLKFAFHGPKEEKTEESKVEVGETASTSTRVVPPQSPKPPPPLPPSTIGNDRREEKGEEKGGNGQGKSKTKAKTKARQKGRNERGSTQRASREEIPYRMLKKIENTVSIRDTRRENRNGAR